MHPSPDNLAAHQDAVAEVLFAAMDAAGAHLRDRYLRGTFRVDAKGSDDLVTTADREAESLIVEHIRMRFPGHRIVAEEAGLYAGTEETIWYIDPLDGTLNFANHLGSWSTCGAAVVQGEAVAAAVVDPLYAEAFRTDRGSGPTVNGTPIAVRHLPPEKALVHVYVGGRGPWQEAAAGALATIAPQVRRLRILGSLALALSYVAAGRLDGVVQLRASSWDFMAGATLVRDAGGLVTDPDGQALTPASRGVLAAATPALHGVLLQAVLNQPRGGW